MRINLSTRLSLAGMLGLALLSATHWARAAIPYPSTSVAFALGVLPNLAAAIAMPLILTSMLPSIAGPRPTKSARRHFHFLLLFTTLGLCTWELIQTRSSSFVFDINDIGATVVGAVFAFATYMVLARPPWDDLAGNGHEA